MSRVFVSRQLPGTALDELRASHEVILWPEGRPPTRSELVDNVKTADGLISLLTDQIDAEFLDQCPNLVVIANLAVGYDNIDIGAATSRRIAVGNTPDVLTDATADHTFALLLAAARHLTQAQRAVERGEWTTWDPMGFLGQPVYQSSLLVVGCGRIGRAVIERASGFKMKVTALTKASREDLLNYLPGADFVTLHCPLSLETRHLIDAVALRRMRPTSYLINTARGGLVDTDALAVALRERQIAGAAVDVSDPEPLPPEHPLLRCSNLTITPHIASATYEARGAMAAISVQNILAGLAGKPLPRCVNPEVHSRAAV